MPLALIWALKITEIQNAFDIVYALDENEWNGVKSIQLLLKDLQ